MAGNQEGGVKAAQTNKERYGRDFYINMGRRGGKRSAELAAEAGLKRGFAAMPIEKVREAGRIGGTTPREPRR